MPFCSVAKCAASNRDSKGLEISFFSFPKCAKRRAEWVHRCGRANPINLKTARICSKHFKKDDLDPSCLQKRSFGIKCHMFLKDDAIPSVNLPTQHQRGLLSFLGSEREKRQSRRNRRKTVVGLLSGDADVRHPAPPGYSETQGQHGAAPTAVSRDDAGKEIRDGSGSQHDERQVQNRKELIDRILEEYDKEQEAKKDPSYRPPDPIGELRRSAGLASSASPPREPAAARPQHSAPQLSAGGSDAAADPSDDDRLSLLGGEDGALSAASDSDGAGLGRPAAGARTGRKKARLGWPGKFIPLKMCVPAHLARPKKRLDVTLERTREIMLLKLKVRRLEARCLRTLGGPTVPRTGDDSTVGDEPAAGKERVVEEEGATPGGEGPGVGRRSPLDDTDCAPGEQPLVILRNDRNKTPSIIKKLRANQLSDSMATFMPSNFQEAKELNHQLKAKLLKLQAVMLSWAIRNHQLRTMNARKAEEGETEESAAAVRGPRLRELLRLEAAVKAMFTEAQLRAIVRNHADSAGDDPAEKRRKHPWGEEDLCRMLELRAISSDRVVEHVQEKMKIPLPSMKTAKLRCGKSPRISEAYKEMLQKSEENQKLCDMCKGQVNTIDFVIDAADDRPPEAREESAFGRQFVQHLPRHSQRTGDAGPKKRPRTAKAGTVTSKKKKHEETAALDWRNTSDSDAELSDPGLWDRIPSSRLSWQPDLIGGTDPPSRPQQRTNPAPDPFGYGRSKKSWW